MYKAELYFKGEFISELKGIEYSENTDSIIFPNEKENLSIEKTKDGYQINQEIKRLPLPKLK